MMDVTSECDVRNVTLEMWRQKEKPDTQARNGLAW